MIIAKTIDVNVKPNFVELQGKSLFFSNVVHYNVFVPLAPHAPLH
jgi:hypothetical protein